VLLAHYLVKGAGTHPDGERAPGGSVGCRPCSPAAGNGTVVVIIIAAAVPEEIFHIDRLLGVHFRISPGSPPGQ
jgi:hypothetical protein